MRERRKSKGGRGKHRREMEKQTKRREGKGGACEDGRMQDRGWVSEKER